MPGNVVELRPKHDSHLIGEAFCVQCGHEWSATAPAGTTELQCPECKTMKGLFKFIAEPEDGRERWQCNCGCQLFYIMQSGHMCANCGVFQTY